MKPCPILRWRLVLTLTLTFLGGSVLAGDAPAVRGEGDFTVPGGTQTLHYRAYASKSKNGDNTAKFLLLLCNTNADPSS